MDSHVIGVTVALALAAGMVAQSAARHVRLPGIVLLLAAGMLLGPDVAGVIQPESLKSALPILVGFAVAVILFEGGMNLDLKRLRGQARVIRRLLTLGALVTMLGGALAARLLMGWDWGTAFLFGTLVIVTGPTVVTPLLRRIKLKHKVATVLEAEGVLIDAVGAVAAVVALEVVISLGAAQGDHIARAAALQLAQRLSFGIVAGLAGGVVIALLLRSEHVVPRGLENVLALSLVLALYQTSDFVLAESGIMAVTVAGMVVGNVRTRVQRDLLEFKEQLTVLLVGMLFVLLAASVRLADLRALGWAGVATVAALMLLIRPLNVMLCTIGSDLGWRERVFVGWLAPRGIVAAAVASLFAQALKANGLPAGAELQALVFLVIGGTVLVQGLTCGPIAGLLGLRRVVDRGYAILGANELGHTLGRLLREGGEEVRFLDSNPAACHVVEQDGFKVLYGNVLEERVLQRARLDDLAACIAVTANEEANLLFARRALEEFGVPRAMVGLRAGGGVSEAVVARRRGAVLFGAPRDLELWALRLRRRMAPLESWRAGERPDLRTPEVLCLPLVVRRGGHTRPANGADGVRGGDLVVFAIFSERLDEAHAWLGAHGWSAATPTEPVADDGEATGRVSRRGAARP